MNARQAFEELRARHTSAWETSDQSLRQAQRDAHLVKGNATAPDDSVMVVLDASFRIQELGIHPRSWDAATEDSIANAVIDAYNSAIVDVNHRQRQLILERLGIMETEQPQ